MFFIDSPHPPGTVAIISHELSRYADFSISLLALKAPGGSALNWHKGVEIAAGLNNIIRDMIGEWLWILGDDHTFGPDILLDLLNDQVDIVTGLCPRRTFPYYPVVYLTDDGKLFGQASWAHIPPFQLFEVAGAGNAGMLIRKPVLDAIGDPWFVAGKTTEEMIGEDLYFCRRAREKGFKVHVDSRRPIGHMTPVTLWPGWDSDHLACLLLINGDRQHPMSAEHYMNVVTPTLSPLAPVAIEEDPDADSARELSMSVTRPSGVPGEISPDAG